MLTSTLKKGERLGQVALADMSTHRSLSKIALITSNAVYSRVDTGQRKGNGVLFKAIPIDHLRSLGVDPSKLREGDSFNQILPRKKVFSRRQ